MKIVTGYTGTPHITSNDDQGLLQGIVGTGSYILPVSSQFAYTLISANELQISDGEGVLQGVHFRIDPGTTESVTIENGAQGMQRIDLVCVHYNKAVDTGIESVSLVVHKGTPAASSPVVPEPITGDILSGDNEAEMPLYTVTLNGLSVTAVSKVANNSPSLSDLNSKLPFVIKNIEVNLTIPQGTASSPSSTEIDLSSYAPPGKNLYNALVAIGNYSLPYIGPNVSTYTYVNRITSNKILIYNGGASWSGTQTVYIVGFFK